MSEINKIKVGDITYDIEDSVARDIDINWQGEDLNNYTTEGVYNIKGNRVTGDNMPINNEGNITARLNVLVTEDNGNNVVTQVLNLNNNQGGEGNVYIRSQQNGTWKPWGKLQTNVEVGQITPDDMSNLTDNGIYSGVCVDGTTIETFVLIVINNYLAASQAGFGSYVSQLKYAIDLNRGNTVKTRTRDAYGIWNEWSEIGGSTYELPEATRDILGGVKLGTVDNNNEYTPLTNIPFDKGSGVGISIDSSILKNSRGWLSINYNKSLTKYNNGFSVNLGTNNEDLHTIPCCIGTTHLSLDSSVWDRPHVGIPYNTEQFCLKSNGLNLKDDIGSGATKVTWDANSNMNNYIEPGIYDIYGERTNSNDNLPITQAYNGASIAARLTVVASTLQPENTEKCITQFLQLSNRMGGEGNTYIRTYNENNNGLNGWSPWQKQMGMVETLINSNDATVGQEIFSSATENSAEKIGDGLNGMIDNGMYSGIFIDNLTYTGTNTPLGPIYYLSAQPTFIETFVLVVINDYAVSNQAGTPRRISQLKYATDTLTGQCTVKKRVGTGSDSISWSDWEEIGGGSSEVDITDAVKTYGLPTLVAQGLAKEGITYTASITNLSDISGKLDIEDKIYQHLSTKDITGLIEFKFTYNDYAGPRGLMVEATVISAGIYYKYMVPDFTYEGATKVLVSADMTPL